MSMTTGGTATSGHEGGRAETAAPTPMAPKVGSLRDFVLANFPLLGAIGGMTAIATFIGVLPLYTDWVRP